jgi:HD-like signal output (HDOD) protein
MNDTSNADYYFTKLAEQSCLSYALPAPTGVLVEQLATGRYDRNQLIQFFESHPPLSDRSLRLANAKVFNEGKRFSGIRETLDQLGASHFGWLSLTVCLPGSLLKGIDEDLLDQFWRYTISKALAARALTLHIRQKHPNQAFACVVLQHVGILALLQQLGQPYAEFLRQVWEDRGELSHLEIASLGFDHRSISAKLVASWGLDSVVHSAMKHPLNPADLAQFPEPNGSLAKRLQLAEQLARVIDERDELSMSRLSEMGRRFFELSLEALSSLLNQLDQEIDELSAVFQFAWQEEPNLDQLIQEIENRAEQATPWPENIPFRTSADTIAELDLVEPLLAAFDLDDVSVAPQRTSEQPANTDPSHPQHQSPPMEMVLNEEFLMLLQNTVNRCRQRRCPMALALVEIDDFDTLQSQAHDLALDAMIKSLSERHLRFRPAADLICHIGPCRWAFVMEDIELSEAVQDCRGRKEGIRYWANHRANQEIGAATVSFGVAWLPIPTKNFDAQILFEKAERCLSGAQLSGGDTIKSISV